METRECTPAVIARHAERIREAGDRIRRTAEGDGGKFKDYDPARRASEAGMLDKFSGAVASLTGAGIPNGMAHILAEVLHLPAIDQKPSAPNTEQSADDASRLTDAERAAICASIPPRSKHSSARVSDDDMVDTIDRLLTMRRLNLSKKAMRDWPRLKARIDQLVLRGAFDAIADALDDLDFSDARKRELRSLCDSMSKRKVRLADLKAERDKAGRF
jgi:hypothetical protein